MNNASINLVSIDQNWQNGTSIAWFEVTGTPDPEVYDGQYGVMADGAEYTLVDCDGAPLQGNQHYANLLDVLQPLAAERMAQAV